MVISKALLLHGHDGFHEGFEGDETILIFLGAGLDQYGDDLFLLHPLTKRAQNMFELGVQHGAVSFLVVKLQYFHEVLVGAAVLVLLNLRVNGQEFIELHLLGLLLLLHSELFAEGNGRVEVESPQAVGKVEGVHCIVTFEVVNGEGKLCPLDIASTKVSHGVLVNRESLRHTTIRCYVIEVTELYERRRVLIYALGPQVQVF